jgi:predicted transcriptional regulator
LALSILDSNGLKHPIVQKVIQIAKEIADQNKPLTAEILYNKAKKRLELSRKGLLKVIQYLFNKKILVEGSRYTRDTILLNPYRKKIYNFIKNNIGAHFSLIRKEALSGDDTKGSPGHLIWHVEKLLRFKLIKKLKVGKYTLFLPIKIDDNVGLIYFILRDELNKKIITLFIDGRQLKKADIYKLLDEPRELVYYRLNNLMEYNILTTSEQDSEDYILSPSQKELIKEILNAS